ncbi:hypothetical protein TNIN_499291 [Trichonephila inaurata madagascariensis]|uniref:Uncharacterized protein n=1 Tax=Trichonephila inaurata madagascariensis TaxID=2747483 RepID=A0A8X6YY88_9ARAC|nr:hypothetical protein TNIN_499291 [Trichonephila inaurata madagascariensis]
MYLQFGLKLSEGALNLRLTLFEVALAADLGATNFDEEIDAVRQAICHLTNLSTTYRRAVFFENSQAVNCQAFCSLRNSDSVEVEEVRKKNS